LFSKDTLLSETLDLCLIFRKCTLAKVGSCT
jgi:hypothetical protein